MRQERGFTLIELFITLAIIGILGATAISSFKIYQKNAYDAHADQLIHDGINAVNAGIVGIGSSTGFYWAWTDNDGNIQGLEVNKFIPGMRAAKDNRFWANLDMNCASGTLCPPDRMCCVEAWLGAYHCDGQKFKTWMRWNNGFEIRAEWPSFGCH